MVRLAKKYIREYVEKKKKKLDSSDKMGRELEDVYTGIISFIDETRVPISSKQFEDYLNNEIDWLIDFCREKKRSTGRLSATNKSREYNHRRTIYGVLSDFNLKRKRIHC